MVGSGKAVFFIVNLVQDVNIVRGLAYLVARETDARIGFLVSEAFLKRDRQLVWQRELAAIAVDTGATMHLFGQVYEAGAVLQGGSGLIFAASESNLPAHWETHGVFDVAPPDYLRITLQHGTECIGFLQSREHVMSHGRNIAFGADIVCSWFEAPALTSLIASQRSKLYVTGPPTLLQQPAKRAISAAPARGLVCENMHSVRLRASGDHKASFMNIFLGFCAKLRERGEAVVLRPHPGGQYVLKNNVALPQNVTIDMRPLYDIDLPAFKYGISAPSTILLDMVIAGVPVGLWREPGGVMDASAYAGLIEISTLDDWLAFERDARIRPEMMIDAQEKFLNRLPMPREPVEVYRRFARLITAGLRGVGPGKVCQARSPAPARKRRLVLLNDQLAEAAQ